MRTEILGAATRLFATRGFDGTSVQDVADAVGIKKPSVLHHFESKEALRQAVLDGLLLRWNETLPALLVAASAGEGQFDAVVREVVAFFARDADRARLLIREGLDRPDDVRERLGRHLAPVFENLARYLRKGRERGAVHADLDPEAYLFQMVTLLVCGIAFGDSFGALLPEHARRGKSRERLTREIARIGRSALFRAPGTQKQRARASRA